MLKDSIPIPGTDYRLLCVEYDIEDKTAIIGLILKNELTDFLKFEDVKEGSFLDIFSDYVIFVERVTNESLSLVIGRTIDEFALKTDDTDIFGYSYCDIDNLIPGSFLLVDDQIKIKKGEKAELGPSYFYLDLNNEWQLSLWYKDNEDFARFKAFNASELEKKFVVHENLTKVNWVEGSPEKGGIIYDATGDGNIDNIDDYPIYNEFYISAASKDSITLQPLMSIDALKNDIFKLKGQHYFVKARSNININLIPIIRRIVYAHISNKKYPTDPEKIIGELVKSIGDNIRISKVKFREKLPKIKLDLFKFEPVILVELMGTCRTEKDFTLKIQHLCNIIDGINKNCFKDLIEPIKLNGTINYLEQYLNENHPKYPFNIIRNLRNLMTLRSKKFGTHGKDDPRLLKTLNDMGFSYPIVDWNRLWIECLRIFNESLEIFIKIHS